MISGWRKPEKMQRRRLIYSLKPMNSSIQKRLSALKNIEKNSWPYDFPADRWPYIRTTNPIESTFSTIWFRPKKTRVCVSRTTILTMVYKLGLSAEKGWRKLRGFRRLADVINGVKFIDGIDEETFERQRNAA